MSSTQTTTSRTLLALATALGLAACAGGPAPGPGAGADPAPAAPGAASPDLAGVEAVLLALPDAWNDRDADAWVERFAPASGFTNILGMHFDDRAANRARHAQLFATIFADSRLEADVLDVRPVGEAGAVAELEFRLVGYDRLPPGVEETEPGVLRTRLITVLEHRAGEWRILAAQNTAIHPAATSAAAANVPATTAPNTPAADSPAAETRPTSSPHPTDRLAFLAGEWAGAGYHAHPDGRVNRFRQEGRTELRLDGRVVVTEQVARLASGRVIHRSLTVYRHDPETGGIVATILEPGEPDVVYPVDATDDRIEWLQGDGTERWRIIRQGPDTLVQTAVRVDTGEEIFRMELTRQ